MEVEEYDNILKFLTEKIYPDGLEKDGKRSLRRKSQSYCVHDGRLCYVGKSKGDNVRRTSTRRLVVRGKEEMKRVFDECHKSAFGGHVGRDNTLTKIKERFFWPGFYKDTANMVSLIHHF